MHLTDFDREVLHCMPIGADKAETAEQIARKVARDRGYTMAEHVERVDSLLMSLLLRHRVYAVRMDGVYLWFLSADRERA